MTNNEVIIDGYNTIEERKLLIKTENYSIGKDGLIDGEINKLYDENEKPSIDEVSTVEM